jgi:hypothetical protein
MRAVERARVCRQRSRARVEMKQSRERDGELREERKGAEVDLKRVRASWAVGLRKLGN